MKVFGGAGVFFKNPPRRSPETPETGDAVLSWKKEPKNFRTEGSRGIVQTDMVQLRLKDILSLLT